MKKLLWILLIFCLIQQVSFATTNITFIYLNGSNANTPEDKDWFESGINKLHPVLKKRIEGVNGKGVNVKGVNVKGVKGKDINPNISDYTINPTPEIFFWGYDSAVALESMRSRLKMTKDLTAPGAYFMRRILSSELHDAVWIVKTRHLLPILNNLNEVVKKEHCKGNKVILSGYSMGTFITYKYLLFKLRTFNLSQLLEYIKYDDKEILDFVKEHPQENTCISAISETGIGSLNIENKFTLNPNKEEFKRNYLKLNELSETYCAPKDTILGVINYGSPLAIFNSEIEDQRYQFVVYNKYLTQTILDSGMFFITINFLEDPLGFPVKSKENKFANMMNINPNESHKGFIYDEYGVKSWRLFFIAHESYHTARRAFSKAVVRAFRQGRLESEKMSKN